MLDANAFKLSVRCIIVFALFKSNEFIVCVNSLNSVFCLSNLSNVECSISDIALFTPLSALLNKSSSESNKSEITESYDAACIFAIISYASDIIITPFLYCVAISSKFTILEKSLPAIAAFILTIEFTIASITPFFLLNSSNATTSTFPKYCTLSIAATYASNNGTKLLSTLVSIFLRRLTNSLMFATVV